jgi:hypothetical protein
MLFLVGFGKKTVGVLGEHRDGRVKKEREGKVFKVRPLKYPGKWEDP